jgi:hypothetical protein
MLGRTGDALMGQIVRQVSATTTRYYWYPGEKREWIRAGIALGLGLAVFGVVGYMTRSLLAAAVSGTSVTAAAAGVNLGRRDARALVDLNRNTARRAAIAHTGRAAWRALVAGVGGATAAVLIVNLPAGGLGANWLLPMVPAVVGALAHQAGMLYERMARESPAASTQRPARASAPAKA